MERVSVALIHRTLYEGAQLANDINAFSKWVRFQIRNIIHD